MMKRLGLKTSAKRKFINKGKSKNDTAKDSKSESKKIQPQKLKRWKSLKAFDHRL